MKAEEHKKDSVLHCTIFCEACKEEHLHIVVYRDREKVIIECGRCGFRSNRYRKGGARKINQPK